MTNDVAADGKARRVRPARMPLASAADIVLARQRGREIASKLGFSGSDQSVVATAISELARNILEYASAGHIEIGVGQSGSRIGIVVVAIDSGPGIADVPRAIEDGYSTGSGLGLGLPGVRRLMDEFTVVSAPGRGTCVTVRKWLS